VVWVFGSRPRVYSVETGSPAARAGIQRGDVITHINGISLLTPKGGQLFGATRPGQVVRWTLLRDGRTRYAVARAAERPEQRYAFEDWKRQVKQLSEMSDMTQIREEIARLNARIEHFTLEREPRTQHRIELVQPLRVRQLRYAGVIGGAEVEVRGPGNVIVSESDSRNEVVINTGESVVVIRASDLSKELQKQIQKEVEKKREPR
jgi:hypothetical protein